MIWLDGLDLPQFQHFPVHFAQHYSAPRYPAEDAPSSTILFPWAEMEPRLEAVPEAHAVVRYTSKEEGKAGAEVSPRLGAQCERLSAGASSRVIRETTSAVYHVIDGRGRSLIGDKVIDWVKGDTFSVPSWEPYHHEVSDDEH
jgi:gentisate 1,2-dioxygenase